MTIGPLIRSLVAFLSVCAFSLLTACGPQGNASGAHLSDDGPILSGGILLASNAVQALYNAISTLSGSVDSAQQSASTSDGTVTSAVPSLTGTITGQVGGNWSGKVLVGASLDIYGNCAFVYGSANFTVQALQDGAGYLNVTQADIGGAGPFDYGPVTGQIGIDLGVQLPSDNEIDFRPSIFVLAGPPSVGIGGLRERASARIAISDDVMISSDNLSNGFTFGTPVVTLSMTASLSIPLLGTHSETVSHSSNL